MNVGADDRRLAREFLASGDEAAFLVLYRRHGPRLWLFVLRLLGGRQAEAEDAFQDTWVRAMERLSSFRWESSFSTWLTGIAVNRCRESWRARGREPEGLEDAPEAVAELAGAERLDVERALTALSHGFRAVFVLHDVEGYTHEEIGNLLAIDAGTSKSQLSRARARLRQMLEAPRRVTP